MATHAPILMFQPGAEVLAIEDTAHMLRAPAEQRYVKLYVRLVSAPEKMAADIVRN